MEGEFGAANGGENTIYKFDLSTKRGDYNEIEDMEPTKKSRVHSPMNNIKLENLPLHLIHHIMNFLPCKDATRVSILSKLFYSYWLSFPVLEFNYQFFEQMNDSDHNFFSFIDKTIQLRGTYMKGSLHKLRLSYEDEVTPDPYPYRSAFDSLLNFAVENHCKEIDFDVRIVVPHYLAMVGMEEIVNVSYDSLLPLFSSQLLTVLKLSGLKMNQTVDTFITCPKLNELLINSCEGFQTIHVSSSSLKEAEVKCCEGLKVVRLDGTSLHSFKFEGIRSNNYELHPCDINIPVCDSLRYLHLSNVRILENINKVVTEFLYLGRCDLPDNLIIHNPHVRTLEMKGNYGVENLVISTPNLQCFNYKASKKQECTLDISACLALTVLKLIKVTTITDGWLRSIVSGLSYLKELEISNCAGLENMELKNDNLEKFSLYRCSNLKGVMIDARNMLEFYYVGSLRVYPMIILSTKCNGSIFLPYDKSDPISWFQNMTQFLRCFDHFRKLTLSCYQAEDMIFPREYVWPNKLSPLNDVKHVKLEARHMPSDQTVPKLVESLLWLVPKPLTLTLSSLHAATTSTLKFGYGKKLKTTRVEDCCSEIPLKCWRHFELKIEFQGFDESVKGYLEKFFAPYMH